ncbi:MAG: holo-ACP synthase [Rhodospirillales bacterium 20-64-7]|nr:MAG: holo-ACP synthase [Rhodospirillales bacterium 20-64-7]
MIIGLGSDLCDIRRIEQALARFGKRFTQRIFSETERARAERRPHARAASYAKRFAAKEACAKALGTGFRRGVFFSDLRVVNLPSGQPTLALHGGAAIRLQALVPAGFAPAIHLSLTDEYPYAYANVIISAEPLAAA